MHYFKKKHCSHNNIIFNGSKTKILQLLKTIQGLRSVGKVAEGIFFPKIEAHRKIDSDGLWTKNE